MGLKEVQKHASVVANHLPAWLCEIHGEKVLTSFSAEDQNSAKEIKWDGDTLLNPNDVAT